MPNSEQPTPPPPAAEPTAGPTVGPEGAPGRGAGESSKFDLAETIRRFTDPPDEPEGGVNSPADLMNRLVAKLIDGLLLVLFDGLVITLLLFGLLFRTSPGFFGGGAGWFLNTLSGLLTATLAYSYFVFCEYRFGQTLGKKLTRLRVQGPHGEPPTLEETARRNSWLLIGFVTIVPFIGPFIAVVMTIAAACFIAYTIEQNTKTRRGWHDLQAMTAVVDDHQL